ncbi:hypothetical protein GCM10017673_04750 [Streptosporangium violaceochromogenes]|nr:hypothetical protein GCM10017673_04750 [Streptosporangium violaceochromogenes]
MTDAGGYEAALVEALTRLFEGLPLPGVAIESIRIDGTGAEARVLILFRHAHRPGDRLGFRFAAWDESETVRDPGRWVPVIWANLDEAINESGCGRDVSASPDGVIWLKPWHS